MVNGFNDDSVSARHESMCHNRDNQWMGTRKLREVRLAVSGCKEEGLLAPELC
jgi:hypothetical protein